MVGTILFNKIIEDSGASILFDYIINKIIIENKKPKTISYYKMYMELLLNIKNLFYYLISYDEKRLLYNLK